MNKLDKRQIVEVIASLLKQNKASKEKANSIAAFLIASRATDQLDSIMREVERRRQDQDGVVEVTATTAMPLSVSNQRAIKTLFDAKQIILHQEIDKQIIGGVRVRALLKSADFSVQARLRQLRRSV
jgi:F0F1-type ATP synthase delta subunit